MSSELSFEQLRQVATACMAKLCEQFPLGYEPQLVWRAYRVTAGIAYYRQGVIGLSVRVLRDEKSVIETLTHEYAHLLAVVRSGNRAAGHGEAWRKAMRDLGQEPKVRHNYSVERNTPRQRVIYQCVRCGFHVVRARRLPKRRRYVHANCGGDLRLAGIERVTAEPCVA